MGLSDWILGQLPGIGITSAFGLAAWVGPMWLAARKDNREETAEKRDEHRFAVEAWKDAHDAREKQAAALHEQVTTIGSEVEQIRARFSASMSATTEDAQSRYTSFREATLRMFEVADRHEQVLEAEQTRIFDGFIQDVGMTTGMAEAEIRSLFEQGGRRRPTGNCRLR